MINDFLALSCMHLILKLVPLHHCTIMKNSSRMVQKLQGATLNKLYYETCLVAGVFAIGCGRALLSFF